MKDYKHVTQQDYEVVAGPDWPPFAQFQLHNNVPEFVYKEINEMLRNPSGFFHPSFCVLPFFAIEYPRKIACCLMNESESIDSIKSQMLRGIRPDSCKKCWALEDAGLKSDRQIKNETLDFFTNVDLEQLINDCKKNENKIVHYKFDSNNICNAACVTCSGMFSSTWNKIERKNNISKFKNWKILPEQTVDWVDYKNAKSISFRGGESFLSNTNFYILEQLVEHKNLNCFVSFVTNGSFSLTTYQKEILLKFKNLNFCFSIDGIGPVFEYLRWPLKWSTVENNIAWCRSQNIEVSVSYTLSNMNLIYHNETIQWFHDQQINYLINPVYDPIHFRPQSLPAVVKQKLNQHPNFAKSWLTHSENDEHQFEQFHKEILKQDSMKNINIKDYLPELIELLNW